jgi:hypothetical protein
VNFDVGMIEMLGVALCLKQSRLGVKLNVKVLPAVVNWLIIIDLRECEQQIEKARQRDQEEILEIKRRYASLQNAAATKERESLRIIKNLEGCSKNPADEASCSNVKK